jgi:probable HAF family extracellular repeat protein
MEKAVAKAVPAGWPGVSVKFVSLSYPGALSTFTRGINDFGQITGHATMVGGSTGFLYDGSSFTPIAVPGVNATFAHGINNSGQVVGWYWDNTWPYQSHGFLMTGGSYTTFDYPGAFNTLPFGINDDGQIAGSYDTPGSPIQQGFVYAGGTFTNYAIPGAKDTSVYGISASGYVWGAFDVGLSMPHGFYGSTADSSSYTAIDHPDATQGTFITGANWPATLNEMVGCYYDASGLGHAFLYDGLAGFTSLDQPGSQETFAMGINGSLTVAGWSEPAGLAMRLPRCAGIHAGTGIVGSAARGD